MLLLLIALQSRLLTDQVDVIEVNHFCDAEAKLVFDQVIFWRWNPWESHYRVVAFRILKDVRGKSDKPDDDSRLPPWIGGHASPDKRWDRGGQWVSHWWDELDKVYRMVTAPSFRETWTQYDPEVEDRQWLAMGNRAGLRKR